MSELIVYCRIERESFYPCAGIPFRCGGRAEIFERYGRSRGVSEPVGKSFRIVVNVTCVLSGKDIFYDREISPIVKRVFFNVSENVRGDETRVDLLSLKRRFAQGRRGRVSFRRVIVGSAFSFYGIS